ncbi:MAG TPA: NAD(P)H-binding protein [Pseudonocardiaceae bacterium]|nr:NAD(P)H-binding protein [Pseudonocardiaceae bacterium]
MKLTIVAATGGIGRHALDQALAAGHDVTAVARNPSRLPDRARRITVDLARPDPAVLQDAVQGADAVLSGLGPRGSADHGITSRGTRLIVEAMLATGTHRLIVVSAAPMGTVASPGRPHPTKHDPGDGFVMRYLGAPFARTMFAKHYADLGVMEDILRDSTLDWTIMRPPRLTDKPLTGTYRTAYGQNLRRGPLISRADVAHCMLRTIDRPDSIRQTVGIAY